jgi:predicted alpha/beta-fold hydrolase
MPIHGHYWTIAPAIKLALFPPRSHETRAWTYRIEDASGKEVLLTGQWREISESKTLGVVIHGLGGNPTSASVLQLANAMEQRGWSTLRYAMRGSESGLDFYHSGLSRDVLHALSDPRLAHYDEIFIAGLSLGGHVTMRLAASDALDDRVAALAAICAPLDLDACARFIDKPGAYLYREYVLGGLREHYERVVKNGGPAPISLERMRQIKTIQEWDSLVTVQRFGFETATQYYASQTAIHTLDRIERPTLYAAAIEDPMVPAATSKRPLEAASRAVDVRWVPKGGHVYFPPRVDLGVADAERSFEDQVVGWLESRRSSTGVL